MCQDPGVRHYECAACGKDTCTDVRPGPGAGDDICPDCFDLEDAL